MNTGAPLYCEHCGAQNEPGAAYCESCGRPLIMAAAGRGPFGGRGRAVAAAAGAAVLLLVAIVVVVAVTRDGDDGGPEAAETFGPIGGTTDTTDATETTDTGVTDTSDGSGSLTADEEELYSHIPAAVGTENCEADPNSPGEALAGAVCELPDEGLVLQYYLLPDSGALYAVYDTFLADREQVTAGDCPDEAPAETEWVDSGDDGDFGTADDVTRGRWACYLTSLAEGDDAHVVWTHDDFLILSVLSHIAVDSDTASLVEFWSDAAGPE